MLSADKRNALIKKIYACPRLKGMVISYRSLCDVERIISQGDRTSENYNAGVIVVEEIFGDGAPKTVDPGFVSNRSALGRELIGAGLACGFAGIAGLGVVGGGAAEVPSAGSSTVVVVIAWTGFSTAAIQCLNSVVRLDDIARAPDSNSLQRLDANTVYSSSILIVDAVGVISGLASLGVAGKNLWIVLSKQRSFVATRLSEDVLRNMSRADRAKVVEQLMKEASQTEQGALAIKAAAEEAKLSASFTKAGANLSVSKATSMARTAMSEIDKMTLARLQADVNDVLKTSVKEGVPTVAGIGASATPSDYVGSASGSVNWLIHMVGTEEE